MLAKVLLFTVNLPFLLLFTSFTLGFFSAIFPPSFVGPLSSLLYGLNSLWTPNANSVRHLIRHINSISPLIAVIPLCREFVRGVLSGRRHFFFSFFFSERFAVARPVKRIYLKRDPPRNDSKYTGRIMHSSSGLCWLTLWCDPPTLQPFSTCR